MRDKQNVMRAVNAEEHEFKESLRAIAENLERKQRSLWLFRAQCCLRERNFDDVLRLTAKITSRDGDSIEGHYLQGVAQLAKAVEVGRNEADRNRLFSSGLEALRICTAGPIGAQFAGCVAGLMLAVATLEMGNYEAAWEAANRILDVYGHDLDLAGLHGPEKTQAALASALRNISGFRLLKDGAIDQETFPFALDAGSIGVVEAHIFQRVLLREICVQVPEDVVSMVAAKDWVRYLTYLAQVSRAIRAAGVHEASSHCRMGVGVA